MITLNDTHFIAAGTNRACYVHPEDPNKCLKVVISGNNKESHREISYYQFLLKRDISWAMVARFYGTQASNKGEAEVVELIRDNDDNISHSLDHYFRILTSEDELKKFIDLLIELKRYLFTELIYVKDLNAVNIVYQKSSNERGKLVVIDGLAYPNRFKALNNIDFFTKKKINKSWKHFIWTLKKRCSSKYHKNLKILLIESENQL
ncbi:YrbL family protein [Sulfurimonas paralvinellae]|uniref:PhoP regulatory network protein YrbL n=1 Tax=Sulfurimonas paralvinellae TaxID=317658 RepID=A0A7M1B8T0_9BACT|nr:YrbL family protein [Sulfurimonas paralvinellae]QOP46114.1 hypothetical protein FM071_07355 [Sulfurimonas paralvinellae]